VAEPLPPRVAYLHPALEAGYRAVAYWLDARPDEAIARNGGRSGRRRIPLAAILGTYKRLEIPHPTEGFAEVWRVEVTPDGFVTAPLPGNLDRRVPTK